MKRLDWRSLLIPLTPLYAAGVALRARRLASGREPVRRLAWPVVSIGNLSTGGSGKTPLAIALARLLTQAGAQVDVLSRGYGRSSIDPVRVKPTGTAQEFGDEPLLIARATGIPVYVAPLRYDAGLLAESAGAPRPSKRRRAAEAKPRLALHLLDDGFQHRQLHRDVDILLLASRDLHDRLLPAGNLRETLRAAERAHVLAIPADDPEAAQFAASLGKPAWRLERRMTLPATLPQSATPTSRTPVLAFCGIARPGQFLAGLQAAGVPLVDSAAFPDHHPYTPADLAQLADRAQATGASFLITTEKDAVRLGAQARSLPPELPLLTAALTTEIEDAPSALAFLLDHIRAGSPHSL